jgi:hypothetical protein
VQTQGVQGGPAAPLAVDPDELTRAAGALADGARAFGLVAGHLAEVLAGMGGWAVDGDLPWSAERFLNTTRWLTGQVTTGCTELSARVGQAGRDYAQTEMLTREGFERDSVATP